MNTHQFNSPAADPDDLLQQRAERLEINADPRDPDARVEAYRQVIRAAGAALSQQLPTDFAAQLARQVELDRRELRYLQWLCIGAVLAASGLVVAFSAEAWWHAFAYLLVPVKYLPIIPWGLLAATLAAIVSVPLWERWLGPLRD